MTREEYNQICDKRFGTEVYEKLRESRVAVAGLGGLGSHIAVMLARSCIGTLRLIDFDYVDISNLNRQEYYVEDIGKPKDRKSTRLNSSHKTESRMPSSA